MFTLYSGWYHFQCAIPRFENSIVLFFHLDHDQSGLWYVFKRLLSFILKWNLAFDLWCNFEHRFDHNQSGSFFDIDILQWIALKYIEISEWFQHISEINKCCSVIFRGVFPNFFFDSWNKNMKISFFFSSLTLKFAKKICWEIF